MLAALAATALFAGQPPTVQSKSVPESLPVVQNKQGLPGLRVLADIPLRDTSVCRGPDGVWYLSGTVEPFWSYNQGIKVWKSKDMKTWEPLGFVFKYGESPWHKLYLEAKKPLWAPEIHYLKGTFWLTYSIPGYDGTAKTSGCGLLKSTSGKAEGPYVDVHPDSRLGDEIDASLFQDDEGRIYFLWHSGKIALMNKDMTGLAEPYHWVRTVTSDPDPHHHSGLCEGIFGKDSYDHIGYEGVYLIKRKGVYYMSCSENFDGRYSCSVASSRSIYGPYSARYEAVPYAGHQVFFQDEKGGWWTTLFGDGDNGPVRQRPAVLPIKFSKNGKIELDDR